MRALDYLIAVPLLLLASPAMAQSFFTPETIQPLAVALGAVVVPVIIAGIKWGVGKVPDNLKFLLPLLAMGLGLAIDQGIAWASGTPSSGWMGVLGGAGAVLLRELKVQFVKIFSP